MANTGLQTVREACPELIGGTVEGERVSNESPPAEG